MQNQGLLWGIGAVVVVAAGIGVWIYSGAGTANAPSTDTAEQQAGTQTQSQAQSQSLKSLITYQGSQKCSFTSATADSNSTGTVYVSNGQMRGDFTSTAAGKTLESHMIVKSNTSYIWGDGMPGGFKMSFDSMASGGPSSGGVDPNAQVDYFCGAWAADSSMFALPATIQFQDLNTMMP